MAQLKALRFRVTNFRNIEDSGWVPLDRVTVLVGRNESGKTALLKALHKFNPANALPYEPQQEFPRGRFTRDYHADSPIPVCAVEFELGQELRNSLREVLGDIEPPRHLTLTRLYNGKRYYALDPKPDESDASSKVVTKALGALKSAALRIEARSPDLEAAAAQLRSDLATWSDAWKDRFERFVTIRSPEAATALRKLRDESNSKGRPGTADLIESLQGVLDNAIRLAESKTLSEQVWELASKHVPVFIYFDNYGILDSAINLPRLLEDLNKNPNEPKVRTVRAMFRHVGLTAEEIHELGRSKAETARTQNKPVTGEMLAEERKQKELRSIKLSAASNDITARFGNWWKQRRHKIRYAADGDFFRIWIADDRRPDIEIELESRSLGFQWFFSFYLVFLVESADMHRDAVLLLDEPGLHLHATAQQELISFFEELSDKNQLVYTTHSPFLIDGEHLHRAVPITEDSSGHARIRADSWPEDWETIFPLQAAAGYAMARGLFRHQKNVLVEGMADYYYLHALSPHCRAMGYPALPDDIHITPCGGAKLMGHLASLFLGQETRPVILLDADEAGRIRKEALLKELYAGHPSMLVMLDTALGAAGCETEDLLGEGELLPVLNSMLGATLQINASDRAIGGVADHIEAAAARLGVALPDGWRADLARLVAAKYATDTANKVPLDVLDRASKLFEEITKRF